MTATTPIDSPAPVRRASSRAGGGSASPCWIAPLEHGPDGGLAVRLHGRQVPACVAASCLLLPAAGDTALCFGGARDGVWLLAVLMRGDPAQQQVLELRGDTQLRVRDGALAVEAADLRLQAGRMGLRAEALTVSASSAEVFGDRVRVVAGTVKLVGQLLSSVMDRVQHFSRHYLRRTEGMDRVSAEHLECEADNLLHLRGDHALINGARLVKARGSQIHFG